MLARTALGGIWVYQNYLSRRKGFRCAYSVRHGGTGCSGYAKFAIRDHGLWGAIPAIRQRFKDCKTAHAELQAACPVHSDQAPNEDAKQDKRKRKDRWYNRCDSCAYGGCDCAPLPCFSGTAARGTASKNCNLNPLDGDGCGLDCGGLDCASCDCGGCSCG